MARIVWLIGVLAVVLTGCRANPKVMDVNHRVLFEDKNVARLIGVERQTADRIAGDLLRVRTDLKNNSKADLWIDIQMVWKDREGYELYRTNWAPYLLAARFVTKHEVASLSAEPVDYELRVRRPAKTVDAD